MSLSRFRIVFEKLEEARQGVADGLSSGPEHHVWLEQQEFDGIHGLRRLSLELAQPEQQSHTTI